jgi:hypothetical protein
MTRTEKPDRLCIKTFVAFLQAIGRAGAYPIEWPEDTGLDGQIDAVFGPYAVQHTSVVSLPEGQTRDAWFGQVIGDLERELRGTLGTSLRVIMKWSAVNKGEGQVWRTMHRAMKQWLVDEASKLPDGYHRGVGIPGIPYAIEIFKQPPRHHDGVMFCRNDPGDRTLGARLRDQICGVGHDKLAPLNRYSSEGKTTLLLLQSSDPSLMSDLTLVNAFDQAFPDWPEILDELWFVHHVAPPDINIHDLREGRTWIFDGRRITLYNGNTPRVGALAGSAMRPDRL